MAKLQTFNRKTRKVSGFLTLCKLYIRIRIKEIVVKEQIQWVLLYIQEESADIWKEKILEDLEVDTLEYAMIEEFLVDLKKEFSKRDNKIIKMAELKKVEQRSRIIEKFVQVS